MKALVSTDDIKEYIRYSQKSGTRLVTFKSDDASHLCYLFNIFNDMWLGMSLKEMSIISSQVVVNNMEFYMFVMYNIKR